MQGAFTSTCALTRVLTNLTDGYAYWTLPAKSYEQMALWGYGVALLRRSCGAWLGLYV